MNPDATFVGLLVDDAEWVVFCALQASVEEWPTETQLVEATGLTSRRTRAALARLHAMRLIVPRGGMATSERSYQTSVEYDYWIDALRRLAPVAPQPAHPPDPCFVCEACGKRVAQEDVLELIMREVEPTCCDREMASSDGQSSATTEDIRLADVIECAQWAKAHRSNSHASATTMTTNGGVL